MRRTRKTLKKILIVTPYFYPAWHYGGTPRVVFELAKALAQKGHQVTVVTTDARDGNNRLRSGAIKGQDRGQYIYVRKFGFETYYFKNISNLLAAKLKLFWSGGMRHLERYLNKKFDVAFINELRTMQTVWTLRYCQKKNIPAFLIPHGAVGYNSQRSFFKFFFDVLYKKEIFSRIKKFLALTEEEISHLKQKGIARHDIRRVKNAIDIAAFDRQPSKNFFKIFLNKRADIKNAFKIVYLGRITQIKGLELLLKSFGQIKTKKKLLLFFIGPDENYQKHLEALARKLGLTQRVFFPGPVYRYLRFSVLHYADLVVLPSWQEALPAVPLESLLCETPVLMTPNCSLAYDLGNQGFVELVGHDLQALSKKIKAMALNPIYYCKKAEKGKKYVMRQYASARVAKEYLELIQEEV
jgi:glycosyltransferase involved in cell wall biosynthesis